MLRSIDGLRRPNPLLASVVSERLRLSAKIHAMALLKFKRYEVESCTGGGGSAERLYI
jgi:hypothetical protein